jgi:hypothetical protein
MRAERTGDITECVGVREPCWDAKRRVWQAIDLVRREQTGRRPGDTRRPVPQPESGTAHQAVRIMG